MSCGRYVDNGRVDNRSGRTGGPQEVDELLAPEVEAGIAAVDSLFAAVFVDDDPAASAVAFDGLSEALASVLVFASRESFR